MSSTITARDETHTAAETPGLRSHLASALRRALGEPLLHFLLLGVALFAVYGWMNGGRISSGNHEIVLTLDDFKQLDISFASQWRRQPTPEEFSGLVEGLVRQEVLYREGLEMGLDKNDTIVKRRMAQKVEFLSEDVSGAHEPTAEELQDWYQRNAQKFALTDHATFTHLFFGFDRRGAKAKSDAESALARLSGAPEDSPLAKSLGDAFMLRDYYADRAPDQLAKEFGSTFATGLYKLKPGAWRGPIESGYGWHLIWIESVTPGRIPNFEEVESDVKTAWLADQKAQAWRRAYEAMRAKYTVLMSAPAEMEAARTSAPPANNYTPTISAE